MTPSAPSPADVRDAGDVAAALEAHDYLPDEGLATAVFLALRLQRPCCSRARPGSARPRSPRCCRAGRAASCSACSATRGIDVAQAVYEWDYARQLLHLRAAEAAGVAGEASVDQLEDELYDERFLVRRPLLEAVDAPARVRRPCC